MTAGYVYAITDPHGYLKIGMTTGDPRGRLRGLQTGNHRRLTLMASCREDDAGFAEQQLIATMCGAGLYAGRGEWFAPGMHTSAVVNLMAKDRLQDALQYATNIKCGLACIDCDGKCGAAGIPGDGCWIRWDERIAAGMGCA